MNEFLWSVVNFSAARASEFDKFCLIFSNDFNAPGGISTNVCVLSLCRSAASFDRSFKKYLYYWTMPRNLAKALGDFGGGKSTRAW